MQVASSVAQALALFEVLPRPLGFVPTMGALHDGHLALVRAAREDSVAVAASVFVNPLQFAPGEDLDRYPRDFEGDRTKLAEAGVDVLFAPPPEAMYGPNFATFVDPGPVGSAYEGAARPTHFRGVATVVSKLLQLIRPSTLYLGQKDAQQTAVLRRVIEDLSFPVHVTIVPTVREPDGLAMSSRNAYLSPQERADAPSLHRALCLLRDLMDQGAEKGRALEQARAAIAPGARLAYLDVVDERTFEPLDDLRPPCFVIGAATFGSTRLLDNLRITH